MTAAFVMLAAVAAAGAAAAMLLRSAVHCVLALTVGLAGLAGLYLELGAQFVGFTQLLVYVGAVAILAVFAIMMTQGARAESVGRFSTRWAAGGVIAAGVFAVLAWAIRGSGARCRLRDRRERPSRRRVDSAGGIVSSGR